MSWPAVHINYGNHARYEGIEDIVDILLQAFRGQRIRVSHGAEFDFDSVNIIIDEFTDPRFNIELQRMKERHPKLQLVLVHTEFIRKDFFQQLQSLQYSVGNLDYPDRDHSSGIEISRLFHA